MGDLVQPDFLRRDVPIFVDGLTLRENQRAILEVLFRDYEDAFQAGVEPVNTLMQDAGPRIFRSFMSPETRDAFRSAMEGAQEEIQAMRDQQGDVDPATIEELMSKRMQAAMEETQRIRRESGQEAEAQAALSEMSEGMEKWRAEKAALREAFLSGIKLLLDDEQQQAWPAFERKLVREKALPRGRISGESVDLFRILDQVGVPVDGTPELAALMENYEIRLVEALNARDAYIAQTEPKLMKAMQSMDMAGGLKIVEKQTEMRVRVRDVNEEFRVAIAASLPEEQGAPFKTAALESSFDRIFRTTSAQRAFEQAKAIEGLLPETLEAVIALENAYVAELASLTERLIATTKKEEPKELVRQAERIAGFMSGTFQQRGQDPIRAAMREQRDLSDTYLERLASLLSPEQYQGLSAATQRRGFGGGFENLPEDMRNRILERVDTNGNGQIDPDEEEQARQMFRRGGRGGRGGNGGDTVDGGGPPV